MYLLFDIGGTNMRFSVSDNGESLGKTFVYKTPTTFEEGIEVFLKVAEELKGAGSYKAVSGGIAGSFNKEGTELVSSPNLEGWVTKPLKQKLKDYLDAPVFINNDSDLAALGEAVKGAGVGHSIVAYIGVGTGVGGGRIVNEKIDKSARGFEPGYQYINLDPPKFLETSVSGTAIKERFGKHPSEVDNSEIWDEMAKTLAFGINNAIVFWSPDVVVLGGSVVTKEVGISVERVSYHLDKIFKIWPSYPSIKQALLGDLSGMNGALEYVRQMV